ICDLGAADGRLCRGLRSALARDLLADDAGLPHHLSDAASHLDSSLHTGVHAGAGAAQRLVALGNRTGDCAAAPACQGRSTWRFGRRSGGSTGKPATGDRGSRTGAGGAGLAMATAGDRSRLFTIGLAASWSLVVALPLVASVWLGRAANGVPLFGVVLWIA